MHVGAATSGLAAGTAAPLLQQLQQPVAAASRPTTAAAAPAAAAPPPDQLQPQVGMIENFIVRRVSSGSVSLFAQPI